MKKPIIGTFEDGLVLILKELHDKLDEAVFAAYGWPAKISDEDLLTRIVALNHERLAEEARGLVRWMRADYQVPRFGSVKEKAELDLFQGVAAGSTAATPRASFPADEIAQTAAVMAAMAAAAGPMDAAMIASFFKQGRRALPEVRAVLSALTRTGYVTTGDRGQTYQLRSAA